MGVDFELDDEQGMIRDLVSRFAAEQSDFADRHRQRAEPQGFSAANWRMLGELGLLALPFGAAVGGMDGGPVEVVTVMEGFGRGLCAEPYLSDLLLAGRLLDRAGSVAQREQWLPDITSGERRLVLAHMEHGARFDPLFVQCRAQSSDGRTTLRGNKTFVLSGEGAAGFIVSAREDGASGLSLWLVDATAAGLNRHAYRLVDGSIALELQLHDVTAERLDGGAEALLACFEDARLAACAEMVGIMATMFDDTLEHVRTRKQFGQSIGSFQGIQHRMADQYAALEQSRSWMLRAALMPQDPAAVAGAKSYIGAAGVKLAEECVQFHGGMGVSDELRLGHGHKRILLLATLLGDSESELKRYLALSA